MGRRPSVASVGPSSAPRPGFRLSPRRRSCLPRAARSRHPHRPPSPTKRKGGPPRLFEVREWVEDDSVPEAPGRKLYKTRRGCLCIRAAAILRETSGRTSYSTARLVFRPFARLRRAIRTSAAFGTSTRVSPSFILRRHSSLSFGSQRACSNSIHLLI
jgi:hypothetical protein